jgi:UDP-N-acetylglucosamine/UDP-N-acetylgalactosamine 4-epimerase
MLRFLELLETLKSKPQTWLVTGVAGFIGSNLLPALLAANQRVIGLDNFFTGKKENIVDGLDEVRGTHRSNFLCIDGDIRDLQVCQKACRGVDYVLHLAAAGSVPRSIEDPAFSNDNNVTGFLNLLLAARDQRVRRLVYASSSAVYGPACPKSRVNRCSRSRLTP